MNENREQMAIESTARDARNYVKVARKAVAGPLNWDKVEGAVEFSRSEPLGLSILQEARRKIRDANPSEKNGERDMALCTADGIVNNYHADEFPKKVVADAVRVMAESKQYNYLSHLIYTYSGFREDLAAQAFASADAKDVSIAIELDKKNREERGLSPLVCFVAYGSGDAVKAAADELVKADRWYDLGEAARRTQDWKRFTEITDIALKAKFWGALINARHNGDKRSKDHAANLIRDNATVADVEKAAKEPNWTVVGCIFDWCKGEVKDRALTELEKTGHDYFADKVALANYLREEFIQRNGMLRYFSRVIRGEADTWKLKDDYKKSRGIS